MSILISGSIAHDYVMAFPDSFKNHILPDQIHILNVCFVVDQLKKNFGGCAANIAYTTNLLGGDPLIFAPIGTDGKDYLDFFKSLGLKTNYIPMSKDKLTSTAQITTDKDDNQIIAYYSGAGDEAVDMDIDMVEEQIELALIAPTKKEAMIKHAKECYEKNIPFCFDPSHQLTAFSEQELMAVIGQAKFYVANDYEMKLTEQKTGWNEKELLNHVEVIIKTLGEEGSIIITKDQRFEVPVCPAESIDDPTGAGDAYRGGFFTAYSLGYDLQTCGQVASVAATYAVEQYGTVNHSYTIEEFSKRYEKTYGETISLKL